MEQGVGESKAYYTTLGRGKRELEATTDFIWAWEIPLGGMINGI